MPRYLIYTSSKAADARSAEQAAAMSCDGVTTTHWWRSIENEATPEGALVIEDEGYYDATGLTPDEVAFLWTADQMDPEWFPPSGWAPP
jgi:hypothetical protein